MREERRLTVCERDRRPSEQEVIHWQQKGVQGVGASLSSPFQGVEVDTVREVKRAHPITP
jgi:hypothetical protein